jgi:chaperonin GroES
MLAPLGDRILIRPEPNADTTDSGLFLVEHRKPETMGTVVKLPGLRRVECPGCNCEFYHHRLDVNVGDTVLFSWQSGQEIQIDDERFLLMRESDLIAVIEGVN